jgi:hypothetical protein
MRLRRRRAITWLCIVAMLLLGLAAQHHALSHALKAVQATAAHQDAMAGHAQTCEQCLQFAAFEAAAPGADPAPLPEWPGGFDAPSAAVQARAEAFTAYISRAPPQRG